MARAATYFHCCHADGDPERLLDPDRQWSEPWGAPEHGPCDKCEGRGTALYECRSCLQAGTSAECPACGGRVRFRETCPACLGSGEITHTRRRGLAVFPVREGLYRYLAEQDADLGGRMIVELEGELSEERDLDADAGALLLLPRRVVSTEPLDPELVAATRPAARRAARRAP